MSRPLGSMRSMRSDRDEDVEVEEEEKESGQKKKIDESDASFNWTINSERNEE